MKLRLLLPLAGLVLVAAALPGPADDSGRAKDLIKSLVGSWDCETSFAGFPPSKGNEEVKPLAHGLSCVITATSKDAMGPGMPAFEGHGLFGYDPKQKKWLHAWVDNMDTSFEVTEGTWSEDGKSFTIEQAVDMGRGPQQMVMTQKITGPDTRTFTMSVKNAPADATPMLTMNYKRHAP
jgi:Protein of unknown function (DUF1579)